MNSNKVWGGGEKWHFETASFLADLGYSIIVVTNRNSDLYNRLKNHKSIRVFSKNVSNFSFLNPFKLNYFKKLFLENEVNAIILGLSTDAKVGGMAARMAGVEHIIYRRGSAIPVKNSFFNRFLFNRILTHIITNSEEIRKNIFLRNPTIISPDRVQTIYNGINLANWPLPDFFKKTKEPGCLILGNAGRLVEQKGQDYLISIASLLKERKITFKMYIAGRGELERSLKSRCKKEGLTEEIIFLDFVEDIRQFLKELDIYVSTSLHEGSSHVILEALAAGKPVIAFNISSMPELIVDGDSGYLIPFADVNLLVERIIHLWQNKTELEQMGVRARGHIESHFDFTRNIKKVIELIEE